MIFSELRALSKANQINVSVLSSMNIVTGIINIFTSSHLVFYEHSDLSKLFLDNKKWRFIHYIRRFLYNLAAFGASKIIFVSDNAFRNALPYFLARHHRKMVIVHNPVISLVGRIRFTKEHSFNHSYHCS